MPRWLVWSLRGRSSLWWMRLNSLRSSMMKWVMGLVSHRKNVLLYKGLTIYLNRGQLLSPNYLKSFLSGSFEIFDYLKVSLDGILLITLIRKGVLILVFHTRKFRRSKWLCRRSSWRWRWTVDPDQISLVHWGTSGLNMRPSPWRTCRNLRSGTSPRWTDPHNHTLMHAPFCFVFFFCFFITSRCLFCPHSLLIWLRMQSAIMILWGRPSRRPMSPGGRFSLSTVKLMHWRTRWAKNPATVFLAWTFSLLHFALNTSVRMKLCWGRCGIWRTSLPTKLAAIRIT